MFVSSFTLKSLHPTFSMIDSEPLHPKLSGAVLVCSVPPSGNRYADCCLPHIYQLILLLLWCNSFVSSFSGLVWRYLLTKPIAAVKVNYTIICPFPLSFIIQLFYNFSAMLRCLVSTIFLSSVYFSTYGGCYALSSLAGHCISWSLILLQVWNALNIHLPYNQRSISFRVPPKFS